MLGKLKNETPVYVVTKIYPNNMSKLEKIFITFERANEYGKQHAKEGIRFVIDCIMLEE